MKSHRLAAAGRWRWSVALIFNGPASALAEEILLAGGMPIESRLLATQAIDSCAIQSRDRRGRRLLESREAGRQRV